jgi:hypothetical protein
MEIMKKKDTTAQSEGAEIFSVAELLSRGLISGAYPRNYPDVDVYAFDKKVKKIINIQVKYADSAKTSTISLRNTNFDYAVVYRGNTDGKCGRKNKQCWVIPVKKIENNKITIGQIDDDYLDAWHLIVKDSKVNNE